MRKPLPCLVIVVVLLVVLACSIPVPAPSPTPGEAATPATPPLSSPSEAFAGVPGWLTYTDEVNRFAIQYPPEGGLFLEAMVRIDLPVAPGTNLGEKYLQIEFSPLANPCHTPLTSGFVAGSVESSQINFNEIEFTFEQAGDAGAGNLYEWHSYSTSNGSLCISLDFILHSTNPEMYDPPLARYDQAAETVIFTRMMETFHWLP